MPTIGSKFFIPTKINICTSISNITLVSIASNTSSINYILLKFVGRDIYIYMTPVTCAGCAFGELAYNNIKVIIFYIVYVIKYSVMSCDHITCL